MHGAAPHFDRCNTRLLLASGADGPSPCARNTRQRTALRKRLFGLIERSPATRTLYLSPSVTFVHWAEPLQAGGPRLTLTLRELSLDERSDVTDLTPLSAFRNLQTLHFAGLGSRVPDLMPLSQCTALRHLDLSESEHFSLQPLSALRSLRRLDLVWTGYVDHLAACSALTYLDLGMSWGCNAQGAAALVQPPAGLCAGLLHLDLSFATDLFLNDFESLTALAALTYLSLHGFDPENELAELYSPAEYYNLYFPDRVHREFDLSFLSACSALQVLDLGEVKYLQDVTFLSTLVRLATLDLSHCPIGDLSPLASCTGLTDLSLFNSPVAYGGHEDLVPLASLMSLKSLDLRATSSDTCNRALRANKMVAVKHDAIAMTDAQLAEELGARGLTADGDAKLMFVRLVQAVAAAASGDPAEAASSGSLSVPL